MQHKLFNSGHFTFFSSIGCYCAWFFWLIIKQFQHFCWKKFLLCDFSFPFFTNDELFKTFYDVFINIFLRKLFYPNYFMTLRYFPWMLIYFKRSGYLACEPLKYNVNTEPRESKPFLKVGNKVSSIFLAIWIINDALKS